MIPAGDIAAGDQARGMSEKILINIFLNNFQEKFRLRRSAAKSPRPFRCHPWSLDFQCTLMRRRCGTSDGSWSLRVTRVEQGRRQGQYIVTWARAKRTILGVQRRLYPRPEMTSSQAWRTCKRWLRNYGKSKNLSSTNGSSQ
jgi:hypothetical protein